MNMSVLERQRSARWKWEQENDCYLTELNGVFSTQTCGRFPSAMAGCDSVLTGAMVDTSLTPDPGLDYGWSEFGRVEFPLLGGFHGNGLGNDVNLGLYRTLSCPPAVAKAALSLKRGDAVASEKMSSTGIKKRKSDCSQNTKNETKKTKGCGGAEGDSKITEENGNNSSNSKSSNKKEITSGVSKGSSEVQKPDFIHVRARRGQATDSHSLAERVRREKISERMKFLQDLVPGCNKITGKAGMLDEIINYVQSLQQQVEFLSMKLAAVNSRPDYDTETFSAKEIFPPPTAEFQTQLLSNPAYPQFNQMHEAVSRSEVEVGIRPQDLGLRRSISAPIAFPDTFFEPSCFAIQSSALWDAEPQNVYNVVFDQGKQHPPHPFHLQV